MSPGTKQHYLLDTNIVVQYVRGSEVAQRIEAQLNLRQQRKRPLISVVSIGELEALARKLKWGQSKVRALRTLVRELVAVDISSREVFDAYGEISAWTEGLGMRMGQQNDIWIAATARATGAHLITTDKDFDDLDPRFLRRTLIPP